MGIGLLGVGPMKALVPQRLAVVSHFIGIIGRWLEENERWLTNFQKQRH